MNSKKMAFDAVRRLIGTYPIELTKECQAALLDNNYIPFEFDYNLSDINNIIKAVYDRDEIDIPVTHYREEPVATRISNFEKVHRQTQDMWRCKFDLIKVTRLADLDLAKTEVIDEIVNWIKEINDPADTGRFARSHFRVMVKQQGFDYDYGTDASIELINEYFYEIIDRYKLVKNELIDLAKYVFQRESEYILKDDKNINIFNNAFEQEHEHVNEVRKVNILKAKTNGQEYLK